MNTSQEKNNSAAPGSSKKKFSPKQAAAMVGVIALALLYLVTFLVAIFSPSGSGHLFAACLYATIGVPILTWIYIWIYGKVTGKDTITSPPKIDE